MASFFALLFLLVICGCWPADSTPAPRSRRHVLPSTQMPLVFGDRTCPLSAPRLLQHMQEGTLIGAVCKSAHLTCDPDVEISAHERFLSDIETAGKPLFFRRSDVWAGRHFPSPAPPSPTHIRAFLPQAISENLPFTHQFLPALMRMLRIPSGSRLAQHMENTVTICTQTSALEAANGEEAKKKSACVSSVEEMVQYATSRLGCPKQQLAILQSTRPPQTRDGQQEQQETMTVTQAALKSSRGSSAVVCNEVTFPFAVFMCDVVKNVEHVEVTMSSIDGKREMNAVMQCEYSGDEEEERCEWLSDRSVVWVVEKEQEQAGGVALEGAWSNEKDFGDFFDKVGQYFKNVGNAIAGNG